MDLYCPRCGEPADLDYVYHELSTAERIRFTSGRGCPSCFGKPVEAQSMRAMASGAIMDALGDDLDGAAATLEDFGF